MSSVRPSSADGPALGGLDAVIGLGSNLGDRHSWLRRARAALAEIASAPLVTSPLYETDAVGVSGPWPSEPPPLISLGGPYLNAAVRFGWNGSPQALLTALLSIERRFGRIRRERFGPRTLDLDVLFITGTLLGEPDLVVPHPRLLERRFALQPLLDVAPDARHPATRVLLSTCLPELPMAGVRRVADSDWADGSPAVF